jgi:hypothetical protein
VIRSLEHLVRVNLSGIRDIWVVQQVLDAENELHVSAFHSIIPRAVESGDPEQREACELTCLMVIAGFHCFSSSRIDKQIVPEG